MPFRYYSLFIVFASLSRIHLQKAISSISSCTNLKSTIMFQVGFIIHSLDYISEYLIRSSVLKVFEKCWVESVKEYQIVRFLKIRVKPTSSAGEHDLFSHHLEKTPGLKGTDFDVDGKASVWHTWQSALTAVTIDSELSCSYSRTLLRLVFSFIRITLHLFSLLWIYIMNSISSSIFTSSFFCPTIYNAVYVHSP